MIKRKVIETVEEYDENGKLTRKVITETNEDDQTNYQQYYPLYNSPIPIPNWFPKGTEITCNTTIVKPE